MDGADLLSLHRTCSWMRDLTYRTRGQLLDNCLLNIELQKELQLFYVKRDVLSANLAKYKGKPLPDEIDHEIDLLTDARDVLAKRAIKLYIDFDPLNRRRLRGQLDKKAICCKKCDYYEELYRALDQIDAGVVSECE